MIISWFYFLLGLVAVLGDGEFLVTHSPPSAEFVGEDSLFQSTLPEVFGSTLGFTVQQESDWRGLIIKNPFEFAEAVVVLSIDGINNLGTPSVGKSYKLITDQDEQTTFRLLRNKLMSRYVSENVTVTRVDLSLNAKSDIRDEDELNTFMKELAELENFINRVDKDGVPQDGIPDVYWIVFRSLHMLSDVHGGKDSTVDEAIEKMKGTFGRLNSVFDKLYDGRVMISAIASDSSHTRRTRTLLAAADPSSEFPKNLAGEFNKDYPVIFNIMLWFMVAFVFALIAVSLAIGTMDPGRDSIIYRMTSNRMKKDN